MFALFKLNHLWDNKINCKKSEVGYSHINTYLSCNTNLRQLRVNISSTLPIKTQKTTQASFDSHGESTVFVKELTENVIDSDSSRKLL